MLEQVEQMKIVIAGLKQDIRHESEQKLIFQSRAVESCELSELWAEKYRNDIDKRKRVHHRIKLSATVAIRRRLERKILLRHFLEWRNLAGAFLFLYESLSPPSLSPTFPTYFCFPPSPCPSPKKPPSSLHVSSQVIERE